MRKKRSNKKHSVKANLQVIELTKAGSSIDLEISARKEKIGRIIIGRGSITWLGRKKIKGKRFSWTHFAEIMEEYS
jgi:hypothetical protein